MDGVVEAAAPPSAMLGRIASWWLGPVLVALVFYGYIGYRIGASDGFQYRTNVQVGTTFVRPSLLLPGQRPRSGTGNDGQFYFVLAQDPFLSHPDTARSLDNTLRYRRLLYPLLAWGLSLGDRELVPYTLVLVNLLAAVGLVAIAAAAAVRRGLSAWWALCLGVFSGVWISVILDLTEPTHVLLLTAGSIAGSAGLTLLSAIAKETGVVAMLVAAIRAAGDRDWPRAARWTAALGAVGAWSLVVSVLVHGAAESTLGGHFLDPAGAPFLQLASSLARTPDRLIVLAPAVLMCILTVGRLLTVRDTAAWAAAAYAAVGLGAGNNTWVDPTAYYRVIAGAVALVFVSWLGSRDRVGRYVLVLAAGSGVVAVIPVLVLR